MDGSQTQAVEAEQRCAACDVALYGRYCHLCGDDSLPPVRNWRDLVEDLLDNAFDFTSAVPRTMRALFTRPSLVPRALRSGDRRNFLPPVKLYISATVVFFLFIAVTHAEIVQWDIVPDGKEPPRVVVDHGHVARLENAHLGAKWLRPHEPHARNREAVAAFDAAIPQVKDPAEQALLKAARAVADHPGALNDDIETWAPRALWVMMPLYALLLWALYRKGRLLSEHVIFTLWAHALLFLMLMAGAGWNMVGLSHGLPLALLAYQLYVTASLKGYYDDSWGGAAWKGAVHTGAYIGLIWLPVGFSFVLLSQAHGYFENGVWKMGLGL